MGMVCPIKPENELFSYVMMAYTRYYISIIYVNLNQVPGAIFWLLKSDMFRQGTKG